MSVTRTTLFGYRPELPLAWAAGTFFLYAFFQSVKAQWPEHYFAFDSHTDPIISRSILHYLAYRAAPVYVACLFVGVSLDRAKIPDWHGVSATTRGVTGVVLSHLLLTNGRSLLAKGNRRQRTKNRIVGIVFLQLSAGCLVFTAAFVALFGRRLLAPLVPKPNDLSAALWTGLAVAALAGWLIDATKGKGRDHNQLVERSRADIDPRLVEQAKSLCRASNTEWSFIEAIMIYENLQRPPWFRKLEKLKSRVSPEGSYGIMQVASQNWISDSESVEIAIARLAGSKVDSPDASWVGTECIRTALNGYNPDDSYVEGIRATYEAIISETAAVP
jgi:hypothetical protein